MLEPLDYPFFQRALAAALAASIACGVVGSYVVVRRIASISGGLSHAAFGGVGLGYLLGFDPMLGATGFALACGVGLGAAERRLRSGFDTLIAMIWAVGMALGIVFVSLAPGYAPDLMSYLFGNLLFVPARYVGMVLLLDLLIVLTVGLLFKEFQAVCFDERGAEAAGVPVAPIRYLLLALVSLAVVTLIRIVGVILVIALLTIPAAIARQWTDTLLKMMIVATVVGAGCSTAGLFSSYWLAERFEVDLPTGPLIVLIAVVAYAVSALIRAGSSRLTSAAILATSMLLGCGGDAAPGRPIVAVAVPPQAFFVERVAGDLVEIEVMIPPGANPSTHSPTMSQTKEISRADLYFGIGHPGFPFERNWLEPMLSGNAAIAVVDAYDPASCSATDPHVWVAPSCVEAMAIRLEAALSRLLPQHRETLRANLDSFRREIGTLDLEIRDTLHSHAGSAFLVFHPSWGSFAAEYGLVQLSIEHEGKDPSPRELSGLIEQARSAGIRVVFVQPQFSTTSAETVAQAIDGRVVIADPLASDWPANLRKVASAFRDALDEREPRADKR